MRPLRWFWRLLVLGLLAHPAALPARNLPGTPSSLFDPAGQPPAPGLVTSGGTIDTVFYGGTFWAADSARWEAVRDGKWTFGSGTGSALVGPGQVKPPAYHRLMEGWSGLDLTAPGPGSSFRRMSDCALTGNYSLRLGVTPAEVAALCWPGGVGYGNNLQATATKAFSYGGSGAVTLAYQYRVDAEPVFDYLFVEIDTTGTGLVDNVPLFSYTGTMSGTQTIPLNRGVNMRSTPGTVVLYFTARSDEGYSDEDGYYDSACGLCALDNVQLSGAINNTSTFESGPDGWALPVTSNAAGDWSDLRALSTLPPPLTACACDLQDSVLVFTLPGGGEPARINNVAVSPWIDLQRHGDTGRPGRVIEFAGFNDQPLLARGQRLMVQYYPYVCPYNGRIGASPLEDALTQLFAVGGSCTSVGAPTRVDCSSLIPPTAQAVRIAVGVYDACAGSCTGTTSSTPWFDNIRFGIYGTPNAPLVTLNSFDLLQDNFATDGTRGVASSGRVDAEAINGDIHVGSVLGDTLVARGDGGNTEVQLVFHMRPGPFTNLAALTTWGAARWTSQPSIGPGWYSARMDTAERGGAQGGSLRWMSALHEADPHFGGGTDSDRGGDGDPRQLSHDIFPDHILTPGARIDYFVKSRYLPPDPRNPGGTTWFIYPDTTGRRYLEMEILPSSLTADTTWNCVLLVDHHADRDPDGQELIEQGLSAALGAGGGNAEGTRFDRFDVNVPGAGVAFVGRPTGAEFGVTAAQLNAYQAVTWHCGSVAAFSMGEFDAQSLNIWMTGTPGHRFWGSGDNLATGIESSNGLTARTFLHDVCGVTRTCDTVRLASCPAATSADASLCLPLGNVGGAHFTTPDPGSVRGNGCPGLRSFDLLSPRVGVASARGQLNYLKAGGPVGFASVTNARSDSGFNFRTVVDGFSAAYLRVDTGVPSTACSLTSPVARRAHAVFDWFRGGLPYSLCNPLGISDADPDPIGGGPPVMATHLNSPVPNPMQGAARITYAIGQDQVAARLLVFDVTGRLVRALVDQTLDRGPHEVTWDGRDERDRPAPAGLYFVRLSAGGAVESRKLLLTR